jgi:mRNA-degrading endonuclease RelE of RelBE toxin-antitoxin system
VIYRVELRSRAENQFRSLPKPVQRTMVRVLDALVESPRPKGAVRLQGTDCYGFGSVTIELSTT